MRRRLFFTYLAAWFLVLSTGSQAQWIRPGSAPVKPGLQFLGTSTAPQQPLMNIATNGMIMNAQGTVSGTKTRQKGRRQYTTVASPVTSLQAFFDNWFITNNSTAAAETDNASAITFQKVAVVYNGVSAPLTFGGSRSATMAAGANKFTTDELTTQSLFGVALIPARSAVEIRWLADVPSAGTFTGTQNREVSAQEQAFLYDPAVTPSDDVDSTGVMSTPSGATVSGMNGGFPSSAVPALKPTMLGGRATGSFVSVFMNGDSLADGVNDTGGDGTPASMVLSGNGGGYLRRAAWNANVGFMVSALSGRSLANYVANRTKTLQYMPFHTSGVQELVTNDVANPTAAQTNRRIAYADMKGQGLKYVVQSLIGTYTTSTDQWTTTANQTPTTGYASGGNRDTINTAIIADVGTNGLDNYIDVRTMQDDATDNHKWAVRSYTATLSTALTGAGVATFQASAAPPIYEQLVIDPTGSSGVAYTLGPVKSVTGTGPYTISVYSGFITTTKPVGASVRGQPTKDGLHHGPLVSAAIAADAGTNGTATVFGQLQ